MEITKIEKIEAIPIRLPFARKAGMQKDIAVLNDKSEGSREQVIVKIHTDEEIIGIGEIEVWPVFSGESSTRTSVETIRLLEPVLRGESVFDIEKIWDRMNKAVRGNLYTKTGIDIALYDAVGKRLGTPLYNLLGGKFRETVPLDYTVWLGNPEAMLREAVEVADRGFKTIRLKIGAGVEKDVDLVKRVRDAIGWELNLRVDANCAYSKEVGIKLGRKLEPYDLEFLEDPIYGWDKEGQVELHKSVGIPILADDWYYTIHDVYRLIKEKAADAILLRVISRPGGVTFARKALDLAEAACVPCLVGTGLETGIATAACLHFAAAFKNLTYACDQYYPWTNPDTLAEGFAIQIKDGHAKVPEGPGLGIEINEDIIEEYRVDKNS